MHMHSVDNPKYHDIKRLLSIQTLLASPLAASILRIHPNDLFITRNWDSDLITPSEWMGWWDWAANEDDNDNSDEGWIKLVRLYTEHISEPIPNNPTDIPSDLYHLIRTIRTLQLDRTPHLHHLDAGSKHTLTEIAGSRGTYYLPHTSVS